VCWLEHELGPAADRMEQEAASGAEPYFLHHVRAKPWLEPVAPNPYTRLLPRLLLEADVALRLGPDELPPTLTPHLAPHPR